MYKQNGVSFTLLIVVCGLWFIGQGSYIHAKALLAQVLLESAWAETLHGAKEVKPWPWADTWPVNRLSVPALGVSRIVLAGVSGQALAFGPGRLFNSGNAGPPASVIIAGHRDTHFRFIREIKYGDVITLQTGSNRIFHFTVTGLSIVNEKEVNLSTLEKEATLILITCFPFSAIRPNGPLRYLVQASLIGANAPQHKSKVMDI